MGEKPDNMESDFEDFDDLGFGDAKPTDYSIALTTSFHCQESAVAIQYVKSRILGPQIQRILLEMAGQRYALTLSLRGSLTGTTEIHTDTKGVIKLPVKKQESELFQSRELHTYRELRDFLSGVSDKNCLEALWEHDRSVSRDLRRLVRLAEVTDTTRKVSGAVAEFQITNDRIRSVLGMKPQTQSNVFPQKR